MSFKKYGGNWNKHCIQFTPGACIEPKLLKFVQSLDIDYECSLKGEIEEVDQPGAFCDIEFIQDNLGSKYYFDSIVSADASTDFIICGMPGDYNVKSTIENFLNEDIIPKVYMKGIASIDKGEIINNFVKENKLEII